MRFGIAMAAVAAMMAHGPADAFAQASGVTIPYGSWIGEAENTITTLALAAFAWAVAMLPLPVRAAIRLMRVEQMLEKAISYGINAVAGASRDKALTVDLGNAVVNEAVAYLVRHAPKTLIEWAGGWDSIKEKILARLNLEPEAAIDTANRTVVRVPNPRK